MHLMDDPSRELDIRAKLDAGEPLSFDEGMRLYESRDIHTLGELANAVRERLHGRRAYYNVNLHINYTNYCVLRCKFCSFYRPYPGRPRTTSRPDVRRDKGADGTEIKGGLSVDGGYELTVDEIVVRAKSAYRRGATEVHIVGGLHPNLPFSYYTDMCKAIREACPHIHIKAFTAIEIIHFTRISKPRLSIAEVLTRLREAGLGSLPGGGAEIFDHRVHDETFKAKVGEAEWFEVHETAHELGIFTNATMLYGHVETRADRINHLIKLREHQEQSLHRRKAHFNCVIPLSFVPEGSALEHLPGPSGLDDLKTLAMARLMCPNIPHIKAFWIMQTPKLAQVSLNWGVDDIDGTVVYYDITKRAVSRQPSAVSHQPSAISRQPSAVSDEAFRTATVRERHPQPPIPNPQPPIHNPQSTIRNPQSLTHQELTVETLKRLIVEAGCEPVERDTLYRRVIRDETTWRIEGEP